MKRRTPPAYIQKILDSIDPAKLLADHGYQPVRYSGNAQVYNCPMPNHDDSSPSFHLYNDGHYHCYGCSAQGDAINLKAALTGQSERSIIGIATGKRVRDHEYVDHMVSEIKRHRHEVRYDEKKALAEDSLIVSFAGKSFVELSEREDAFEIAEYIYQRTDTLVQAEDVESLHQASIVAIARFRTLLSEQPLEVTRARAAESKTPPLVEALRWIQSLTRFQDIPSVVDGSFAEVQRFATQQRDDGMPTDVLSWRTYLEGDQFKGKSEKEMTRIYNSGCDLLIYLTFLDPFRTDIYWCDEMVSGENPLVNEIYRAGEEVSE